MSRICPICDKRPRVSTTRKLLRGNYNPTSKKKKYPNLQWTVLASGKKAKVCAKCKKNLYPLPQSRI